MKYADVKCLFSRKYVSLIAIFIMAIVMLTGCGNNPKDNATSSNMITVGLVQFAEHPALDESNKGFIEGLKSQGYVEGKNIIIKRQNAQGNLANLSNIADEFIAEKVNLIGAISTPSAQIMADKTTTIPIVGMAITDYKAAKLVKTALKPGTNITGVSDRMPPKMTVNLIKDFIPKAKTIGVIYNENEINSVVQVKAFKKAAHLAGLNIEVAKVSKLSDVQQATVDLIKKNVDAVFLPTDNIVTSAWPTLIKIMTEAKIPVFPTDSAAEKFGALAMYSVNYHDLGVQAGIMASKILKGEDVPEDMPIEHSKQFKLVINKDAAKILGIKIPKKLIKEEDKKS